MYLFGRGPIFRFALGLWNLGAGPGLDQICFSQHTSRDFIILLTASVRFPLILETWN
jgi:hypothetical protein